MDMTDNVGNIFKMSFITAGVSCWSPSCISVKTDWPNDHSYLTRSLRTKLLSCPNTHLALLFLLQSSKIIGQYGPHTRTVNYEIIQSKISMSKRETRTKGCRDLLTFMVVKLALTVSYDVWSWSSHFYNFWNLADISFKLDCGLCHFPHSQHLLKIVSIISNVNSRR